MFPCAPLYPYLPPMPAVILPTIFCYMDYDKSSL